MNSTSKVLIAMLLLALLTACTPDELETRDASPPFAGREQFLTTRVSFDLESVTERKITSRGPNDNLAFLDDIASEIVASRQFVQVGVYPDGRADYVVEERVPSFDPNGGYKHNSLPNDLPSIHRTEVIAGIAYFYDRNGNLLSQHDTGNDNAMRRQVDQLTGTYKWMDEALEEGAEIEELDDNTIIIRRPYKEETSEPGSVSTKAVKGYTEEVVVTDLNILLGHSLHEADGTLLMRTIFKYSEPNAEGLWLPEMSYTEEYGTDEVTGTTYIEKTTNTFNDFQVAIK